MDIKKTSVTLDRETRQLLARVHNLAELTAIIDAWLPVLQKKLPQEIGQGITYQAGEDIQITNIWFARRQHYELGLLRAAAQVSVSLIFAMILRLHFAQSQSKLVSKDRSISGDYLDFKFFLEELSPHTIRFLVDRPNQRYLFAAWPRGPGPPENYLAIC